MQMSYWFMAWMQRAIRSQLSLCPLHWQMSSRERHLPRACGYTAFYIAALEADQIDVLFAVYSPRYPMSASRVSTLERKYLLALVPRRKVALHFRGAPTEAPLTWAPLTWAPLTWAPLT